MLYELKELQKLKLANLAQELGYVHDFYFDDQSWVTRYIVVDTGNWLTGKKVLVSPSAMHKPNFLKNTIHTNLSIKQIENSPPISKDEPVSRQQEIKLSEYYGWPAYWSMGASRQGVVEDVEKELIKKNKANEGDPNLRSIREVIGYSIEAVDGEVGKITDFIIDDQNWIIKYLVVDTNKILYWLPVGNSIVVSPEWINDVDWGSSTVFIGLNKKTIENGPEFKSAKEIDKKFEDKLNNCYKNYIEREIITP